MLDEQTKKEILDSIMAESARLRYGKIFIEIHVVDSMVIDMELETKKRVHFKKISEKRNA